MPTLNVNVSQEALDKLESVSKLGKGNFVSTAILQLSAEKYLQILASEIKEMKTKSAGKKKST